MQKKVKALSLMSGGLDSQLAAKVLMKQGIEVTGLCFETPFFSSESARQAAEALGINLIIKDITEDHLEIVKDPANGYGKNMNPCIDCHGFMFEIAGKMLRQVADEEGFDVVSTGEVLGQRPMSQNPQALKKVEEIAGLENRILRPLCAKNLEETEYEKEGLVDRSQLLDFQGKTRKPQMALAKKWGIVNYPSPAGGCKLTSKEFSNKLRDLLTIHPESQGDQVRLIQAGRHIWNKEVLCVFTRHKEDTEILQPLMKDEYLFIKLAEIPGPHGIGVFVTDKNLEETKVFIVAELKKRKKLEGVQKFISSFKGEREDFEM
jgi:tRNA U34 2-thiouridine synthase MnmA/TrmU